MAPLPARKRRDRLILAAVAAVIGLMLSSVTALGASAVETRSIRGTVALSPSAPTEWLRGVQVFATDAGAGGAHSSATVDPITGAYEISGLPPGSYRLHFQVNPYWDGAGTVRPSLVAEYYNDTTDPMAAELVDLSTADASGIDATLAEGRSISGSVTIPAGMDSRALGAVWVSASAFSGSGSHASATVDLATGEYTLVGLAPGAYRVQFQVGTFWDGNASVRPNLVSEYYNDSVDYASATAVDLTMGNASGIDAELMEGRTISGTVTIPDDVNPDWIRGVSVSTSATAGGSSGWGTVDPTTGEYSLSGLAPGTYRIAFNVGSYSDGTSQVEPNLVSEYYDNARSSSAALPVDVSAEDRAGVDAFLEEGTSISGTVTLPTGAPAELLQGISVSAIGPDGSSQWNSSTQVNPQTGEYRIERLPAGQHHVMFMPSGDGLLTPEYYDDATTLDQATPVSTLSSDATQIDAELAFGARISGTIDVSALRATAGDESGFGVWITDETGTIQHTGYGDPLYADEIPLHVGVLRPGTYRVAITTSTWDDDAEELIAESAQVLRVGDDASIRVEAGEEITDLHLTARATDATVSGTLTAQGFDLDPVDGILGSALFYERIDDEWVRLPDTRFSTNQNGTVPYTLNVPSGTYTVGYEDDYSTVGVEIKEQWWNHKATLGAADPISLNGGGASTDVDGTIEPVDGQPQPTTRSISGRVDIPAGVDSRSLQAVSVSAFPTSSTGSSGRAAVDPITGQYRITDLAPGSYRLQFNVNTYWDGTASVRPNLVSEYFDDAATYSEATAVDVSLANASNIDAELATGRTISGRVTLPEDADPAWLSAISVNASAVLTGTSGFTQVDPETGDYSISGLAPGAYQVQFNVGTYWNGTTSVRPNLVSEYYDGVTDWTVATPVDVSSGDQSGIDAALEPGRSIAGTVTLPEGAPSEWLSSVSVTAMPTHGSLVGSVGATPDPSTGEYTITGLAPGAYQVAFRVMSGLPGTDVPNVVDEYYDNAYTQSAATPVDVTNADASRIDATLDSGRTISGTVTLPANAPAEWMQAIRISVMTPRGENINYANNAQIDATTGAYTLSRLPAGDFIVHFYASSYYNGTDWADTNLVAEYYDAAANQEDATVVSTTDGNATGIDAELGLGGGFAGTIDLRPLRDGAGDEGIGVTVTLTGEAGAADQGNYGDGLGFDDFEFRFTNLTPGVYRVAVTTYHWDDVTQKPIPLTSQFVRFGDEAGVALEAGDDITDLSGVTRAADASISGAIAGDGFDEPIDGVLGSALVYERLDDAWVRLPGTRFDAHSQATTPFEINLPSGTYTVGYESEFSTIGANVTEQWWKDQPTLAGANAIWLVAGQSHPDTNGVLRPVGWTPPVSPPSAPRSVTAVPGNGQATVSWIAPQSDGGAAISGYTVQKWPGGETMTVSSSTSHVVTGLTNGTSYTFTVIATNSAGDSPASDPSGPVTPSDATPPLSSPFVDVPTDHPFFGAIAWLAESGISAGWDAGNGARTFRPALAVQRDAVAAFLYRYAGSPDYTPPAASPFVDVPTSHPFYTQISWLASTGISSGWDLGGGKRAFEPTAPIQRDAMAAFLYRYTQWSEPSGPEFALPAQSPFVDVASAHPFYTEISWLASTGISTGWDSGNGQWAFQPTWPIQRDAVAAFLHRHSKLLQ